MYWVAQALVVAFLLPSLEILCLARCVGPIMSSDMLYHLNFHMQQSEMLAELIHVFPLLVLASDKFPLYRFVQLLEVMMARSHCFLPRFPLQDHQSRCICDAHVVKLQPPNHQTCNLHPTCHCRLQISQILDGRLKLPQNITFEPVLCSMSETMIGERAVLACPIVQ